jgi:hypothetical protein
VENRLDPGLLDMDPLLAPSAEATGSYDPIALRKELKKPPEGVGGVPTRRASGSAVDDRLRLLGDLTPEPSIDDSCTWLISLCSLEDDLRPNIGEGRDITEALRSSSLDIELTADIEDSLWFKLGRIGLELSHG